MSELHHKSVSSHRLVMVKNRTFGYRGIARVLRARLLRPNSWPPTHDQELVDPANSVADTAHQRAVLRIDFRGKLIGPVWWARPISAVLISKEDPSTSLFFSKMRKPLVARKILTEDDILQLLRKEVERAGSISAWASRERLDRPYVSKVLAGRKQFSSAILKRLKIKRVYIEEE
jgi:hypothetical protein